MLERLTSKLHLLLSAADRNAHEHLVMLDDVVREEGRVVRPDFSRWERLDLLLARRGAPSRHRGLIRFER